MKNILLCISGSIAAYKSPNILRKLQIEGFNVKIVMTKASCEFINPVTFYSLTREEVFTDIFKFNRDFPIPHIDLAKWADCVLIAPASADIISKFAHGLADDLLSSLILAFNGPVFLAPAMNSNMWSNKFVQENVEVLKNAGFTFIGPVKGELACRDSGYGKLSKEEDIVTTLQRSLSEGSLKNYNVIITAGGTSEPIDEVRVITNLSSGKMGIAFAREAYRQRAKKIYFIHTPVVKCPFGCTSIIAETSGEFKNTLMEYSKKSDILIMAAAISDYKPKVTVKGKIKRSSNFTLELEKNEDILALISRTHPELFTLGFALECQSPLENAKVKIKEKSIDMILVNTLNSLGSDSTSAWLLDNKGSIIENYEDKRKEEIARDVTYKLIKYIDV